jgi:hypothetical protein
MRSALPHLLLRTAGLLPAKPRVGDQALASQARAFELALLCASELGMLFRLPKPRRHQHDSVSTRAAQAHAREKVIVYFLTCACVDLFAAALPRLPAAAGLRLAALHGRMKQAAREAVLAAFAAQDGGAPCGRGRGVQVRTDGATGCATVGRKRQKEN